MSGIKLPERENPIRLVGLTGSMGTGKSTAAAFFAEAGVTVIDADEVARHVVRPGQPALEEISRAFGPEVIDEVGGLNRAALAGVVFADPDKRARLEEILHPRIDRESRDRMERALADVGHGGRKSFVLYDVPLLYEVELAELFDLVVVVYADRAAQVERVKAREAMAEEEIAERLAAQLDIEEKAVRADVVLRNLATVEELKMEVGELISQIEELNSRFCTGEKC